MSNIANAIANVGFTVSVVSDSDHKWRVWRDSDGSVAVSESRKGSKYRRLYQDEIAALAES